ncbi:unnamed protein product [Lactuca saligna]|uniref:Uncharacterized protein n=1 Tax=Lactuca saligna TaxID=75948 RepID=A0AA36A4J7_LACSI|nr:unnamed protein product [Lactuca saligna]
MASSEQISFTDQSASTVMLKIKVLTIFENVHLSQAYFTTIHNNAQELFGLNLLKVWLKHKEFRNFLCSILTTTFVTSDLNNFTAIGSIPAMMLVRVPLDNAIMPEYMEISIFGIREIHASLEEILDVFDIPKRGGK